MNNNKLRELFDTLTDDQKEKAKACKTMDEMMNLATQKGIDLPDEAMDAISGGYPIPRQPDPSRQH